MTIDTQIVFLLNSITGHSPLLDFLIVFFATYVPYLLILLLLVVVFFSAYERRQKFEILVVTGLCGLIARFGITEVIRYFVQRPRPFLVLPIHQLIAETTWSFPSGHATAFFAMAMAVYLYHKRWGLVFFAGATLISVARVTAGIHYPSDVIVGAIIGVLTAYCMYKITRKILEKGAN